MMKEILRSPFFHLRSVTSTQARSVSLAATTQWKVEFSASVSRNRVLVGISARQRPPEPSANEMENYPFRIQAREWQFRFFVYAPQAYTMIILTELSLS
jgi:hypothetical protein